MISSCAGAGLSNVQGSVYHTGQMDMAGSYALQGLDAAALRCAVADPGCFVVQYAAGGAVGNYNVGGNVSVPLHLLAMCSLNASSMLTVMLTRGGNDAGPYEDAEPPLMDHRIRWPAQPRRTLPPGVRSGVSPPRDFRA
jgi:hypothetical protein